jgi:hypothetical protein
MSKPKNANRDVQSASVPRLPKGTGKFFITSAKLKGNPPRRLGTAVLRAGSAAGPNCKYVLLYVFSRQNGGEFYKKIPPGDGRWTFTLRGQTGTVTRGGTTLALAFCGDFPGTAGETFHWYQETDAGLYWALQAGATHTVRDPSGVTSGPYSTICYSTDGTAASAQEEGLAQQSAL